MLSDDLAKSIKKMKQLTAVENAAQDVERKAKNDADYHDAVSDFYNTAKKLQQTTEVLNFAVTDETLQLLMIGTEKLSGAVTAGAVDSDSLSTVRQHIKRKLNPALAKEWKSYYQEKTSDSIPKLNTIGHLASDPKSVSSIRENITRGNEWTGLMLSDNGEKTRLELFEQALDEIEKLESRLNLSDEIKDFIMKVTAGKAKLSDVNDDILAWVKAENLEGRFVIRFKA